MTDFVHHALHIAPGHIARNHQLALHVLAAHAARAARGNDFGHLAQGNLRPRCGGNQRIGDTLHAFRIRRFELHHQIETPLSLVDIAHLRARKSQRDEAVELLHRDAVTRQHGAVGADLQLRREGLLFHVEVHHARHIGDFGLNLVAQRVQTAQVGAEHLDSHRRLRARKDMVDTVPQRLSHRRHHARHLGQFMPHLLQERILAAVFEREPHLDFGTVHGLRMFVQFAATRAPRRAQHLVDAQQLLLQSIAYLVVEVERKTRFRYRRNGERTLVEVGQEAVTQRKIDAHRGHESHYRDAHRPFLMVQGLVQTLRVEAVQVPRKPFFPLVARQIAFVSQQGLAKQRRDGHGHEKRHQQRHDIGDAERFEHTPLHAAQEKQRRKGHNDDEGGVENGGADFGGAFVHGLEHALTLFGRQGVVAAQFLVDVLHINDGVVHQTADSDAHAAQGHRIDILPREIEHEHGAQKGEGNGDHGNERGTETAQKEQQDKHHKDRAFQKAAPHIAHRGFDKVGLPEHLGVEVHVFGKIGLELRQGLQNVARHPQGIDIGLFGHRKQDGGVRVETGVPHFDRTFNAHLPHIVQGDGHAPVGNLYQAPAQFFRLMRARHAPHRIFVVVLPQYAARRIEAHGGGGLGHLFQRHPVGVHQHGVGRHLILLVIAAHHRHLAHASRGQDSGFDDPVGQGAQLHHVGGVGFERHEQDFAHHAALRCQNGRDVLRKTAFERHQFLAHNLTRLVNIGAPIKFHPYKRSARQRRRAYPPHMRGPVHGGFDRKGNQAFHLLGGHVLGIGHHGHGGGGEVGKDINIQMADSIHAARHQDRHPEENEELVF